MGNGVSAENAATAEASNDWDGDIINTLPNEILLEIFERLPPYEFSRLTLVCKRWNAVLNDGGLWRSKLFLTYRILKINSLDEAYSMTRPTPEQIIYDPEERVLARQIYKLRQYPHFSSTPQLFLHKLNTTLRPFSLVMFGLGMESAYTNKLTNNILRGKNSTFMVAGLVQGGGIRIRYKSHHILHIVTLYTNIKSVRENVTRSNEVELFSKWLVSEDKPETGGCGTATVNRLQYQLRKQIMKTDGFVYVSDSTRSGCVADDETWMAKSKECLNLIMKEAELSENTSARRPLLLLSGVNKELSKYICADVVDGLGLCEFNRPWSVCDVDVEYLQGIERGFNWLLYSIMLNK